MPPAAAAARMLRRDWRSSKEERGLETNLDGRPRVDLDAVDETHAMRVGLHHDRAGTNAGAEKLDALHQRAIGDAGRGEDDVLAASEIFGFVNLLEVLDAHG